MIKRARLTGNQKVDIVEAYTIQLEPMISIAKRYAVTRAAVYQIIKQAGVDTSKGLIQVSCTTCGAAIMRPKCRIRKQLNHFCNQDCHASYLSAGKPKWHHMLETGNSSRVARSVVSQYFALQADHVVHHENHNRFDNLLPNLRVFACHGDHIRYHHGFDVEPIWDGRLV